jgi:hypothetical protein
VRCVGARYQVVLSALAIGPSQWSSEWGNCLRGELFQVHATRIDYAVRDLPKPDLPESEVELKKWVAVLICMNTKAVHSELVSDLS